MPFLEQFDGHTQDTTETVFKEKLKKSRFLYADTDKIVAAMKTNGLRVKLDKFEYWWED